MNASTPPGRKVAKPRTRKTGTTKTRIAKPSRKVAKEEETPAPEAVSAETPATDAPVEAPAAEAPAAETMPAQEATAEAAAIPAEQIRVVPVPDAPAPETMVPPEAAPAPETATAPEVPSTEAAPADRPIPEAPTSVEAPAGDIPADTITEATVTENESPRDAGGFRDDRNGRRDRKNRRDRRNRNREDHDERDYSQRDNTQRNEGQRNDRRSDLRSDNRREESADERAANDMGPQTRGLSLLGAKTTVYSDRYTPAILEFFENRHPENDYFVKFNCPEFTSLCPITGQPDFATIYISYIPDRKMVESKSLKLYLFGFRNHGAFHEDCVNIIMKDLIKLMSPRYIEVWGKFLPRGGLSIDPFCNYGRPTTRWEEFARQRLLMHDLNPEPIHNR